MLFVQSANVAICRLNTPACFPVSLRVPILRRDCVIFLGKLDSLLFCQHTKPGLCFGLEEVCLREAIEVTKLH